MHRRNYEYVSAEGRRPTPPNLAALAAAMTDDELEAEILAKLGAPDYQLALLAEHERRAKEA